jgi:hypothetical protein
MVFERICIKENIIPDIEYAMAASQSYPALIGYAKVVTPSYQIAQNKPIKPEIGIKDVVLRLNKNILARAPIKPMPPIANIWLMSSGR